MQASSTFSVPQRVQLVGSTIFHPAKRDLSLPKTPKGAIVPSKPREIGRMSV